MLTVEVTAETRTRQGVALATFYRSTRQHTLADARQWIVKHTRHLDGKRSLGYVTIRDDSGRLMSHYQWRKNP
jgi:hypothetical protein